MKRDMDLIRLLLRGYEGEEPKPDLSNYTNEQKVYHDQLLADAGLFFIATPESCYAQL